MLSKQAFNDLKTLEEPPKSKIYSATTEIKKYRDYIIKSQRFDLKRVDINQLLTFKKIADKEKGAISDDAIK